MIQNYVFVCVAYFCLVRCTYAVKGTFQQTSSNVYGNYLQQSFGMAERGLISLEYNVKASDQLIPYQSYLIVLILTEAQKLGWYGGMSNVQSNINTLCNQPSLFRQKIYGQGSINFETQNTDRYSVLVLQCFQGYSNNPISASVTYSMTNARPVGNGYSHMAIQDVTYVRILEGEIILYVLMLAGLIGQVLFARYE